MAEVENESKNTNCDLTPFEKEYLNALLELRLKEYDAQFKRLCKSNLGRQCWKNNINKLAAKIDFVLKIREKLGFIKYPHELSLDEIRNIVRGLENEEMQD